MQVSCSYAVKYRKNGSGRIYITFGALFSTSGLLEAGRYQVDYQNGFIQITPSALGSQKLMNTGRGALVELKNIATAEAINFAKKVIVVAKKGAIKIFPHPAEKLRVERENRFMGKLIKGKPVDFASLYSGLGLLNLNLCNGLKKAGISSRIKLANDICPIALSINFDTNPIWCNASHDALVINDDIRSLTNYKLSQVDVADISLPCNGQSKLVDPSMRDTKHPLVGTLFMPTVETLKRLNACVFIIECTPALHKSDTLDFFKRELSGYHWSQVTVNGHNHGEIEQRERALVLAISSGLVGDSEVNFTFPDKQRERPALNQFLEPENVTDGDWRTYRHVIKKSNDSRLSFSHRAYKPNDDSIPTLIANYFCPKVGSPFIAHPTNNELMRLIQPSEHANIRRVPIKMKAAIQAIVDGTSLHTSKRGSKTIAHRLLGMSVSKLPWEDAGEWIGNTLNNLVFQRSFKA